MNKIVKIIFVFALCLFVSGFLDAQSITWQRTYDGGYNFYDEGYDICKADGNNFYVVGSSLIPLQYWAIKVIKINEYGDTIWTKEIRGIGSIEAYKNVSDNSGGCVITGRSSNGAIFISINKNGQINWDRIYGQGLIQLHDIKMTKDKGYIACGRKDSLNFDCYIIKIDSNGNFLWQKTFLANHLKIAYNVLQDLSGDYLISGSQIDSPTGDTTNAFIALLDSIGNIKWDKQYRINNKYTSATSMIRTYNGFVLSGVTLDYGNSFQKIYFIKLNINGDSIYSREIDTPQSEYSGVFSIANANRFLFGMTRDVTNSKSLARIMITDSLGNILIERTVNNSENIYLKSLRIIENGNILFVGKLDQGSVTRDDFFALRTDSLLNAPVLDIKNSLLSIPPNINIFPSYPNPFNPETTTKYIINKTSFVQIKVFNSLGKEVALLINKMINTGNYYLKWTPKNLPGGIYFCSFFINGEFVKSNKIIYLN